MKLFKKLLLFPILLLAGALPARANQAVHGFCETGNQPVIVSGLTSTTTVQASYPQCTITVFVTGGGLATIFADNNGTPLSNPFTAQLNGQYIFYAANGHYDVNMSGAGFPSPVTISDILIADPANQQAALPCTTLSFSATPAFLATNNICYQMTLTGNVTSSTITGTPANGNLLAFTLTQDGTGGRAVAFPPNFIIPSDFTLKTAANAPNYLTFKYDGTNWSFLTNSGGGGGSTPGPPFNSVQCNVLGILGACNATDAAGVFTISDALSLGSTATVAGALTASSTATIGGKLTVGGEAQFAGPIPWYDLRSAGGTTSTASTTASCTSGSPNVTLASAQDFANGQGIVIYKCGAATTLATPQIPTVISTVTGATTYTYCAVAEDHLGGLTPCGPVGTTTTGPAVLGRPGTSISLTQVVNLAGVATYTCSGNCNLSVNMPVNINGLSNLDNGVRMITTVPNATTFTTYTANIDGTTVAASTASPLSANILNFPSGSYSGNGTLRYWIYRGGALVGVAVGLDPYYVDFGQGIGPNNPAYVPTAPPVSSQNGYLETTITSGGGTVNLVLASNAGTTISTQTALHDNSVPLLNLMQTAFYNNPATQGPSIYIPSGIVFNGTTDMVGGISTGGFTSSRLIIGGTITLNQPWVMRSGVRVDGLGAATLNTSFQPDSSARIIQNSHPGFYINPVGQAGAGGFNYSNLLFQAPNVNNPYTAIYSDLITSGGGVAGIILTNINASQRGASVIIMKGAFGNILNGGTLTGDFFTPPLRLTNSSVAVTGSNISQAPGNVYVNGTFFGSVGIQLDCLPNISHCVTGGVFLQNSLLENFAGPLMGVYGTGSQITGGMSIVNSSVADYQTGGGTPLLDAGAGVTLATVNMQDVYFGQTLFTGQVGNITTGASTMLVLTGANGAISAGVPVVSSGAGATFYQNAAAEATGTGRFIISMSLPLAPVSAVVSAGGSVPIDTYQYFITAKDIDGFESPVGPSISGITTTGGNQTVTVTRPVLPNGATDWYIYRQGSVTGRSRIICASAPASQLTQVDNFAITCGTSSPNISFAAAAALGPSGIYANSLRIANSGFTGLFNFPSNLTANRTWSVPDASGAFAFKDLAQTFTQTQSLSNASQLRFFSTNGTNYAGFQGGASTVNLVWLLPTTDSIGTQCLSSNGSQQFSWSACSGGTGTPGGANTQIQYNNSGTFGGSVCHTWVSPAEILGVAGTCTGQLKFAGTTSGTVTVTSAAAAGTWTFTLPTTAGTVAFPMVTDGTGIASWAMLTVPGGGTGAASFTANQLLSGNGTSPLTPLAGSTVGTSPVLTLKPTGASGVALTLDTQPAPSGDVQDWNINGVKTSWVDNLGVPHFPQITLGGTGAGLFIGLDSTCSSAAVGFGVLCVEDAASHTIQSSLNGGSFKSIPQWSNTGPPVHGVNLVCTTFPQICFTTAGVAGQALVSGGPTADPAFGVLGIPGGGTGVGTLTNHSVLLGQGTSAIAFAGPGATAGQPLLSNGAAADPTFGALVLSGSAVSGILGAANGGTGAASIAAANIVTVTGAITPNNCTKWSSSTVVTDSGAPCGGAGAASRLDQITAATGTGGPINSTVNPVTWNWALTGSTVGMKFGENTAATGSNNIILQATTLNLSTAIPFQTDNNGNGWQLGSTGLWKLVGTGTLAIPGTASGIVISQGPSTANTTVAPTTTGKILRATTGADPIYIDMPDFHYFPAAACVNATASSGWSTSATPIATCRAGTNNKEAFLGPWGASDVGQMSIALPADWDTSTNPSVRVRLASTDATAGHTIIMQVATACGKGDGTTTDDVAFNAAQSFGTVTLVATANQQWDASLSNITMTGCIAGGTLRLQLSRTTDTATNVEIYGLGITIPRLLTVQAN